MITRLVLYSTLGYLLSVLGYTFYSEEFWCVVGLFWASETLTRWELIEQLNNELTAMRARAKEQDNDTTNGQ
jgi:hypothetical protein